jgi:hypothetical protein
MFLLLLEAFLESLSRTSASALIPFAVISPELVNFVPSEHFLVAEIGK